MKTPGPAILLVEDDPNDIFFMQRAINKASLQLSVQVAVNGEEAMNYLAGKGRFVDRKAYPLPCCVFVDLKMPFLGGMPLLEWITSQPLLSALPVYIMSGVFEEAEVERARKLGVRDCVQKPLSPEELTKLLSRIPECVPHLQIGRRD